MLIMNVHVHARTDIGLRRNQNEDHHAWWVSSTGGPSMLAVLVVADGMGGARAGEVASQIAADSVMAAGRNLEPAATPDDLRHIVESANHTVHQESLANPDHHGMGTTCTAMIVRGGEAVFAHQIRTHFPQRIAPDFALIVYLRRIAAPKQRADRDPCVGASLRRIDVFLSNG